MNCKHLFSTNPSFLLQRLIDQYKKQQKIIIAYDFDDTVSPFWCADCGRVQSVLRELRNTLDAYFIVFTSNTDYEKIKKFLSKNDIPYDSINENAPFTPLKGGKLFYNVFLDDKAGLGEVVNTLEQLLYLINNGYIKKDIESIDILSSLTAENNIKSPNFELMIDKKQGSTKKMKGVTIHDYTRNDDPLIIKYAAWEESDLENVHECSFCSTHSCQKLTTCPSCERKMVNGTIAKL